MRDLKQVLNQNKSDRKKADTYNYNYNTTECNMYIRVTPKQETRRSEQIIIKKPMTRS